MPGAWRPHAAAAGTQGALEVGAATTLTQLTDLLQDAGSNGWQHMARHLLRIAGEDAGTADQRCWDVASLCASIKAAYYFVDCTSYTATHHSISVDKLH